MRCAERTSVLMKSLRLETGRTYLNDSTNPRSWGVGVHNNLITYKYQIRRVR